MAASPPVRRMVVGITGASGTVYGIRVLEMLRVLKIESHLVISRAGDQTRSLETDVSAAALRALADKVYAPGDIAAAISSGSFQTMGMIVAPCSVRTLSEIATGVTSSLVARTAGMRLAVNIGSMSRAAIVRRRSITCRFSAWPRRTGRSIAERRWRRGRTGPARAPPNG